MHFVNMNNLTPLCLLLIVGIFYTATKKIKLDKLVVALLVVIVVLVLCTLDMHEQFKNYAPVSHKLANCIKKVDNSQVPLIQDVKITNPVGDNTSLTQDLVYKRYPSIDGDSKSHKHLFMFAHNQCSPSCCPSTYSCSTGCVCITKKQRDHINKRGGNRSVPTSFEP